MHIFQAVRCRADVDAPAVGGGRRSAHSRFRTSLSHWIRLPPRAGGRKTSRPRGVLLKRGAARGLALQSPPRGVYGIGPTHEAGANGGGQGDAGTVREKENVLTNIRDRRPGTINAGPVGSRAAIRNQGRFSNVLALEMPAARQQQSLDPTSSFGFAPYLINPAVNWKFEGRRAEQPRIAKSATYLPARGQRRWGGNQLDQRHQHPWLYVVIRGKSRRFRTNVAPGGARICGGLGTGDSVLGPYVYYFKKRKRRKIRKRWRQTTSTGDPAGR